MSSRYTPGPLHEEETPRRRRHNTPKTPLPTDGNSPRPPGEVVPEVEQAQRPSQKENMASPRPILDQMAAGVLLLTNFHPYRQLEHSVLSKCSRVKKILKEKNIRHCIF